MFKIGQEISVAAGVKHYFKIVFINSDKKIKGFLSEEYFVFRQIVIRILVLLRIIITYNIMVGSQIDILKFKTEKKEDQIENNFL